jgi:hypothetical protein
MGEVKPVAWLHHTCLRGGQVKAHVTFSPENPLTEFLQTQQREEFQATSEALYPASAISVLQAEIEKLRTECQVQFHEAQRHYAARRAAEAPAARLQAERDGDVAKAVAAEREACAQMADELADKYESRCADRIAAAIRTRPALTGESDG